MSMLFSRYIVTKIIFLVTSNRTMLKQQKKLQLSQKLSVLTSFSQSAQISAAYLFIICLHNQFTQSSSKSLNVDFGWSSPMTQLLPCAGIFAHVHIVDLLGAIIGKFMLLESCWFASIDYKFFPIKRILSNANDC